MTITMRMTDHAVGVNNKKKNLCVLSGQNDTFQLYCQ